jgi:hypothetical protein
MSEEFEKILAAFEETPEYKDDSFHWSAMAKYFFLAGQEAERKAIIARIEEEVTTVSVYSTVAESRAGTSLKSDILDAIKARGKE